MATNSWIKAFIEPQERTKAQTITNIIGGALLSGGFIGALNAPYKTYSQATKGTQAQLAGIMPSFALEAEKAEKGLGADLGAYQERAVKAAEAGLIARGIGDAGVRAETSAGVKSGLSGAYATARAALAKAKLNAQTGLSSSFANYQMGLAQKQYESVMNKYASQMGLWGALGGTGASILASPSGSKSKKQESKGIPGDYISNLGEYDTKPFQMRGVI